MSRDPLKNSIALKPLTRNRRGRTLKWGTIAGIGLLYALVFRIPALEQGRSDPVFPYIVLAFLFLLGISLFAGAQWVWSVAEMSKPLDRHPDVLALARYGDCRQIVAAVDAELAANDKQSEAGSEAVGFSARLQGSAAYLGEVELTRNWLVCWTGAYTTRLTIIRVEDVVLAAVVQPSRFARLFAPLRNGAKITCRIS